MTPAIAFRDVAVFDGTAFHAGWTVVVDGDRIAAAGPGEIAPAGAETIDGGGRAVLPGFVDSHVHVGFFEPATILRGGVTTARDLGWSLPEIERIRARGDGPDLLYAGPILTAPGGYPSRAEWARGGVAREVDGADEARDAVRALARAGVALIKVAQEARAGPTFPSEVLGAICDEAHAAGLRVASHCGALAELERALDAGVDELAHGLWSDEAVPEDTIARAAATVTWIPTLHIDPSDARIDALRAFLEAGGRVVYGTDIGNPPVPPGIDPEELALMRRAGMTIEDVLAAATARAAAHLGLGDRGRIEPGARADLVLVDGDPREDLRPLGAPALVLRAGVRAP